jgi:putative transposase
VTYTISDVAAGKAASEERPAIDADGLAEQLVAQARENGVELVGPDGLLSRLTKRVLETALEAEMSEHLGYEKHDPAGRNHGNSRNGIRSKTVLTEIGPVEIDVPRDIDASFQPRIVRSGRDRRAPRYRRVVPAEDCAEATTAVDRGRPDRVVAVRAWADDRGDLGALRRGLRRVGVERHRVGDH